MIPYWSALGGQPGLSYFPFNKLNWSMKFFHVWSWDWLCSTKNITMIFSKKTTSTVFNKTFASSVMFLILLKNFSLFKSFRLTKMFFNILRPFEMKFGVPNLKNSNENFALSYYYAVRAKNSKRVFDIKTLYYFFKL